MVVIDKEWMRRYVEGWREVNRITDAERAERLRNMTDEQCLAAMSEMLWFCVPRERPRQSGLVEFQRLLRDRR